MMEIAAKEDPTYHLRRVRAELRIGPPLGSQQIIVPARVFSNELNPLFVRLFTPSRLPEGQQVSLVIAGSSEVFIRGKVSWSQLISLSTRVFSKQPFCYRTRVDFLLRNPKEKDEVRQYALAFRKMFLQSPTIEAAIIGTAGSAR